MTGIKCTWLKKQNHLGRLQEDERNKMYMIKKQNSSGRLQEDDRNKMYIAIKKNSLGRLQEDEKRLKKLIASSIFYTCMSGYLVNFIVWSDVNV